MNSVRKLYKISLTHSTFLLASVLLFPVDIWFRGIYSGCLVSVKSEQIFTRYIIHQLQPRMRYLNIAELDGCLTFHAALRVWALLFTPASCRCLKNLNVALFTKWSKDNFHDMNWVNKQAVLCINWKSVLIKKCKSLNPLWIEAFDKCIHVNALTRKVWLTNGTCNSWPFTLLETALKSILGKICLLSI